MEKQNGKKVIIDEDGFEETLKKSKPTCNVRSCWICNENYQPRNNFHKPRQRKQMNTNYPRKYCINNCKFCTKLIERLNIREQSYSNIQEDNYFTVFF